MPEDIVGIFTADRKPTGRTTVRYQKMDKGEHRQVIHICIFNSRNQMLIQHRVPTKKSFPGFWDVSAGGGVTSGETPQYAAERELSEELGIDHRFTIAPAVSLDSNEVFDDFFVAVMDLVPEDLELQRSEVDEARWADLEEIEKMVSSGEFIPYQEGLLNYLFHVGRNGLTEYRPVRDP